MGEGTVEVNKTGLFAFDLALRWLSFDASEALADLDRKEEERRRQEPMLF